MIKIKNLHIENNKNNGWDIYFKCEFDHPFQLKSIDKPITIDLSDQTKD